jgi:SAM-dependent methyltransferase
LVGDQPEKFEIAMLEWLLPVGGLYVLHRLHLINVDYPIRQLIRWRRPGCVYEPEPKDGLIAPEAEAEVARLVATYGLEGWRDTSRRDDYEASLWYMQMLERGFHEAGVRLGDRVTALDAGPSNWFYVQPLLALLRHHGAATPREVALDGVEIDAFRIYSNWYSRHDWALAFSQGLEGVRYLAQDVRGYDRPVDVALMLFPFLFPKDHLQWGLPRRALQPAELLRHVAGLVKPGGWLVIANHGAAEREAQHRLLADAGLEIAWWGRHDSALFEPEPERYLTIVAKGPSAG